VIICVNCFLPDRVEYAVEAHALGCFRCWSLRLFWVDKDDIRSDETGMMIYKFDIDRFGMMPGE